LGTEVVGSLPVIAINGTEVGDSVVVVVVVKSLSAWHEGMLLRDSNKSRTGSGSSEFIVPTILFLVQEVLGLLPVTLRTCIPHSTLETPLTRQG
jgi:hypothetical protein